MTKPMMPTLRKALRIQKSGGRDAAVAYLATEIQSRADTSDALAKAVAGDALDGNDEAMRRIVDEEGMATDNAPPTDSPPAASSSGNATVSMQGDQSNGGPPDGRDPSTLPFPAAPNAVPPPSLIDPSTTQPASGHDASTASPSMEPGRGEGIVVGQLQQACKECGEAHPIQAMCGGPGHNPGPASSPIPSPSPNPSAQKWMGRFRKAQAIPVPPSDAPDDGWKERVEQNPPPRGTIRVAMTSESGHIAEAEAPVKVKDSATGKVVPHNVALDAATSSIEPDEMGGGERSPPKPMAEQLEDAEPPHDESEEHGDCGCGCEGKGGPGSCQEAKMGVGGTERMPDAGAQANAGLYASGGTSKTEAKGDSQAEMVKGALQERAQRTEESKAALGEMVVGGQESGMGDKQMQGLGAPPVPKPKEPSAPRPRFAKNLDMLAPLSSLRKRGTGIHKQDRVLKNIMRLQQLRKANQDD